MNILLLAPELFTGGGGIPRILRLYLKALCERTDGSDNVRFLSLNDRVMDTIELKRYSTRCLAEWEVCSRSKASFIRGALQMGRRSDVLVCGHVAQLPVAWAASKINRRLRYYLVAHGIEVWRRFSLQERIALRGASGIWCVSAFTRQQLLARCPLDQEKVLVLPNALDPLLVPPSPPLPPPKAPNILTISRLSEADNYKGIDHMIDAMPAVLAEIPDARLRIVGRGDALASLQSQAAKRKVNGAVEFPGYRSDTELREDFARCRVFSMPSEKEGFGLVYLEAFAHGRPCLGARSGGTPEVISEEAGSLVEYGNVPAIASTLVAMLRRDWPIAPLLERAEKFSYLRFKERVASLIST